MKRMTEEDELSVEYWPSNSKNISQKGSGVETLLGINAFI